MLVEAAERDDAKQLQQAESFLAQNVKALVIVPHSAAAGAKVVEAAKKRSVPVICYDRLILDADVDLYVSFDNRRVGELQAQYLRNTAPKGNYILLGGAPTDHNARAVLMAMATYARQTGAYVIAEGIEDDDTLLFLQQIESAQLIGQPSKLIQGGQGFSLAQPGPLTTDDTANLSLLGR